MSVLGWIIVGLVAGGLAGRVTGYRGGGCITTMVVGIVGGLIGGAIFSAAGDEGITGFGLRSMFVAFIGATILLLVFGALTGRGRGRRRRLW